MAYLIRNDYLLKIQFNDLDQILTDIDSLRIDTERAAITRIKSRLTQKYDVSSEFKDTKPFNYDEVYKAGQLVYLDASDYTQKAYDNDEMVLNAGKIYYNTIAITTPEAFTVSKWELLGNQYDFFYVSLPADPFNIYFNYSKDDITFYKDKLYTNLVPSQNPTHQADLQYSNTFDIPLKNYFPDTPTNGPLQWGNGESYAITNTWPTDTLSYTKGDNRNAELVETAIYMTIYKLSPRISPRNIPDIWVKNFDDAEKWLIECAKGMSTLDLPLLQPRQGSSIRMGSSVQRKNSY